MEMKKSLYLMFGIFLWIVTTIYAQQSWNVDYIGGYHQYGDAYDVFVVGNYVYLANGFGGLRIVDVSNPASPQEVGYYDTVDKAVGVYVSGSYAYVANYWDGLRIIDVSNPSSPQEVGYYDTRNYAMSVHVSGGYAYVADGMEGLRIIDVSNPSSPQEVGYYDMVYLAMDVYVSGSYAYVADRDYGLRIIDVSNPSSPQEVGHFNTGSCLWGVYVTGSYAYVANDYDGLRIIDVSNPSSPQEVGYYDTGDAALGVYVSSGYAYVADWMDGLRIIDVSNPSSPQEVGYYDTGNEALGVYVSGSYAYVADGYDGLRVIDVSNPSSPQEVGYYNTISYARGVYVTGSYAYVADRLDGLRIIDVSNPSSPQEVGYYDTGDEAMGVYVNGSYAYVADWYDGLYILQYNPTGQLAFSHTQLNFGNVDIGTSNQKTVTITNNGVENITVNQTFISGVNAFEFSITSGGGAFTLTPSQFHNITVSFIPQTPGSKQAYLIIQSNAPTSPDTVLLTGVGTTTGNLGLPFFDDFSDNDDSDWEWLFTDNNASSDPSHSVVNGQEVIYTYDRQQTMLLNGSDTLANYTIEADVTITRGLDDNNLKFFIYAYVSNGLNGSYYLFSTEENSSEWSIIRAENGSSQTLASGSFSVVMNHTYHVKWIINGNQMKVNVDGNLLGEAFDPNPLTGGKFGIGGSDDVTVWDNISVYRSESLVRIDETARLGKSLEITVIPPANFNPTVRRLYYRPAGYIYWDYKNLIKYGDNYIGTIPGNFMDLQGVEYYVYLSDGQTVITYPEVDPENHPEFIPVQVGILEAPISLPKAKYKMVSIPLQLQNSLLENIFEDDYDDYDVYYWRLFYWMASYQTYYEYDDGIAQSLELTPGMSIWLIVRDGSSFNIWNATSVDARHPYEINLSPGWNQIGNPFAFPVAWDSIGGSELVQAPVWWNGSEYKYNQSTLQPWEGYFVYNPTGQTVQLSVPPRESYGKLKKSGTFLALKNGECALQLEIEEMQSHHRDTENYVGMLHTAADGLDARDFLAAPPIENKLTLDIVQEGNSYAGNFKAVNGNGATWDLVITDNRENETVRFSINELSTLPEGFQVWLMDTDRRCVLSLNNNETEIQMDNKNTPRHLKLILGTEEFAEQNNQGIPLVPLGFSLQQNYPNPFNPKTHITYQLSEACQVRLDVYNPVGQKVRTLVNQIQDTGIHTVVWDGRDDRGLPVASGVYLYRIEAGNFSRTRKMVLLR